MVDRGEVVGIVSLPRLQAMSSRLRANLSLSTVLRTDLPQAQPDEPIEDVLKRMTDHSLSVIPVMDKDSGEFLGSVTSENVLELAVLMDEIAEELEQRGENIPQVHKPNGGL